MLARRDFVDIVRVGPVVSVSTGRLTSQNHALARKSSQCSSGIRDGRACTPLGGAVECGFPSADLVQWLVAVACGYRGVFRSQCTGCVSSARAPQSRFRAFAYPAYQGLRLSYLGCCCMKPSAPSREAPSRMFGSWTVSGNCLLALGSDVVALVRAGLSVRSVKDMTRT